MPCCKSAKQEPLLRCETWAGLCLHPVVKNQPASAGDAREAVLVPGQEDPLEKETATQSSILAWEIARAEESGWLYSPWG